MKIVNLIQGSPEWNAHREAHLNASDAPAMLGLSAYKKRDQLLDERATGITKAVDSHTQRLFDDGHKFEALARPVAAKIIGEELYPVVGVEGKYSASFDGITMDESIIFEHKSLNENLRNVMIGDNYVLPEMYRAQMDQQLMVSGAKRCLFMASSWGQEDNLLEERHCWYYPDLNMRKAIVDGWDQFERDLQSYVPSQVKEMPKAEVSIELPTLFIHAHGEITSSNIEDYQKAVAKRLEDVRAIVLVNDQDFSNAKDAAKQLREQIIKNNQALDAMTENMSVGEFKRLVEAINEDMRLTALQLEKDVESEDIKKKQAMTLAGKAKINELVAELRAIITPINLIYKEPVFASAIKGKRNYSSMESAINDMVAATSADLRSIANDVKEKLNWFESVLGDFKNPLFPDLQTIIYKPIDDFQLVVNTRVDAQKKRDADIAAEAAKKAAAALAAAAVPGPVKEVTPEPVTKLAEVIEAVAPVEIKKAMNDAVVEHQDEISSFLHSRGYEGARYHELRAVLVEFVKYTTKIEMAA